MAKETCNAEQTTPLGPEVAEMEIESPLSMMMVVVKKSLFLYVDLETVSAVLFLKTRDESE